MPLIDVSADGNCLLHSISLPYLLLVFENDAKYIERFKKLFGDGHNEKILVTHYGIQVFFVVDSAKDEYLSGTATAVDDDNEWFQLIHTFRQRLVNFIECDKSGENNTNQYESFFLLNKDELQNEQFEVSGTFEEYLNKIREDNTRMDGFVIRAASDFLNHPVTITTDDGCSWSYNEELDAPPIELFYKNKNHFMFYLDEEILSSISTVFDFSGRDGTDDALMEDNHSSDLKVQADLPSEEILQTSVADFHNTDDDSSSDDETNSDSRVELSSTMFTDKYSDKRLHTDDIFRQDPTSSSSKNIVKDVPTYSASGVKTSLHGTIYQLRLLMLIMHRGINKFKYFDLATEMDQAEKFDDLAFRYKQSPDDQWHWRFLQAKHKNNPEDSKISINDLLTESDGDFSLQKYFISFCKIKSNPEFYEAQLEEFTLCTNTGFDFELIQKRKNDGSFTVVAEKHNQLINTWKSYLEVENLDKSMFYFRTKNFKGKKYTFKKIALNHVIEFLKSIFLKKCLTFKRVQDLNYICAYLEACEILTYKEFVADISETVKELETDKKSTMLQYRDVAKQVLRLEGKLLKDSNYNKLKETIKRTKLQKGGKDRSSQKEKLFEEIKNIVKDLTDELAKAENKLELFDDRSSPEANNLKSDLEEINLLKKLYLKARKNILETSCVDKIKDILQNCTEIPKTKLDDLSRKAYIDLEDTKTRAARVLEEIIMETVMIEVTLKSEIFSEYTKEFLEKFQFIIDYPSGDELNLLIRFELGQRFGFLDAKLITDSFENEMLDWFKYYNKGHSEFISKDRGNEFFDTITKKIESVMTSGLNKAYPDKLQTYNIRFMENGNLIEEFLGSPSSILHISTRSTKLSAIKVLQRVMAQYQAQDSFIFIRLKSLSRPETQKLILNTFESPHNYLLLVIDCQSHVLNEQTQRFISTEIMSKLMSNDNKKIILIAGLNDPFVEEIKGLDLFECDTVSDTTTFKDLTNTSQVLLLERNISFQEYYIPLGKLIDIKDANDLLSENTLQEIIKNKIIKIGDAKAFNSTGYDPQDYISRYLYPQRVKTQVLKLKNTMIFLTCETEQDFQKAKIEWGSFPNISTVRSNNDDLFNKFCVEHQGKSIHWFHNYSNLIFWKHSVDDLNKIRTYVKNDNVEIELDDYKELKPLQKIVILANDPGVGKSTFITSISRKTKNNNETLWIVRVNLKEYAFEKKLLQEGDTRIYTRSLSEIDPHANIDSTIDFISEMVISFDPQLPHANFQRELFKWSLKCHDVVKKPKIILFFDGFDEIMPKYKENTIIFLKKLNETAVEQIWITTRVHEKEILENAFKSPVYILGAIKKEDQITFLNKFWRRNLKADINELLNSDNIVDVGRRLRQITENIEDVNLRTVLVEALEKVLYGDFFLSDKKKFCEQLQSILSRANFKVYAENTLRHWKFLTPGTARTFINTPLHLKMLAELLLAKNFQVNFYEDLFSLYDEFISLKFHIYFYGKCALASNAGSDDIHVEQLRSLHRKHQILALKLLFPELSWPILQKEDVKGPDEAIRLARVGFLVLNSYSNFEFVHRSFAEFFVGEYLVENFQLEDTQHFFCNYIYPGNESNSEAIAIFFDKQLKQLADTERAQIRLTINKFEYIERSLELFAYRHMSPNLQYVPELMYD